MDYFSILSLIKEPFSNSPDPEFFFHSRRHRDCLQKLELSLLLRRGLNVIIGDVGTGKTTLCRQLIRRFSQKEELETHLILDPHVLNASEFLATVTEMFTGKKPPVGSNDWQIKEQIKQHLFRKGVDESKTIVLIIDEGQKIPVFCLEILREFLNYETNEYKLLQIVIFAQKEFEGTVRKYPNFADRINLYHTLEPLSFHDTRQMIQFRLEKSSKSPKKQNFFTLPALWAIYRISGGYPRKIINLCHQSILSMIIQNRSKSNYILVNTCARRVFPEETSRRKLFRGAAMLAGAAAVVLLIFIPSDRFDNLPARAIRGIEAVFSQKRDQEVVVPVAEAKTQSFRAQIAPTDLYDRQRSDTNNDLTLNLVKSVPSEDPPSRQGLQKDQHPAQGNLPIIIEEQVKGEPSVKPEQPSELVEKKPPETLTELPSANTYSTMLGQIKLKRNETLSLTIMRVYGSYNSKYFKSFIIANPEIEDPDRVEVGQIISLPAIPARVTSPDSPLWWVRVDERDSLETAYNILRNYPTGFPAVRLIPHWNPANGTRFAVVLDMLFKDELAASSQLDKLPADPVLNPAILSVWDKQTVYFSNPYFNGKH
jgi:general secretion pathway protein A